MIFRMFFKSKNKRDLIACKLGIEAYNIFFKNILMWHILKVVGKMLNLNIMG